MEGDGKGMRGKIDRRSWQREKRGRRHTKRDSQGGEKKKTLLKDEIKDCGLLIKIFIDKITDR
jgi:hypothetical protein